MGNWNSGYVTDIGYTHGCYPELNPLRLQLAFLNAGLAFPKVARACELGFGQGMSINLHAAASGVEWHGNDFNPSQAAFAQALAVASGSGAQLSDEAFADFCARPDLPDFDFIGLHGIWSWISDTNRAVIVDFVRRKLRVGGVLYISYNTLPGWASFAPMRHLLTQHAATMGAQGHGIVHKIDHALDFAGQMLNANPLYAKANPFVADRLKVIQKEQRPYLAHEYFNTDWHPMYFADMARWLSPAKVGFACSANLLDHVDPINLQKDQLTFLSEIPDPVLRQTVRDFMVNQQFRKDYWVKGARKLSNFERLEQMRALRMVLVTPRTDVPLTVNGSLGEANLGESVYGPLLDLLSTHQALSFAEIEQALSHQDIRLAHLLQALMVLAGAGHLALAQTESQAALCKSQTLALNTHLMNQARGRSDLLYLASPLTASGVVVQRFAQLFLLAHQQGRRSPDEWIRFGWQTLSDQGQRLIKDGRTLETPEENLAE